MFIKTLIIKNGSNIIQNINFHNGLNLILDETKTEDLKESGNNVGKTTVLRLIDYCFGSSGTSIYKDPEFKNKANTKIETFLKENDIIIELELTVSLNEPNVKKILIRRNFLKYGKKIQEINGENIPNDKEFDKKLKALILNSKVDKPTFRQIIAKNIRDEKNKLTNTLKVLHHNTTQEEYEALFFFLFGISTDDAEQKQTLTNQIKEDEKALLRLKREHSKSELTQVIEVLERDISELEQNKAKLTKPNDAENDLSTINRINGDINSIISQIGALEIRRKLILESKEEIESRKSEIDLSALKNLYKSAVNINPEIHKKFEDLVTFHNNMISNRIDYISKELPDLEYRLGKLNEHLHELNVKNESIHKLYFKSDIMATYDKVSQELNSKYEQKGKFKELLFQWEKLETLLTENKESLNKLNEGSFSVDDLLNNKISIFNKYFSKLSKEFYGEQFILSQEKSERAYTLNIGSIDGNLGSGKKKGQIAAFDFAYISFCEELEIPYLHFILHDQLENMHDNQLITISNLSDELGIQFILPFLKDKLPSNIYKSNAAVLTLSQKNKLFKLD